MSVNWNQVRAQFPSLQNWTYLNTATYGQLPRSGIARVNRHFAHREETACWDFITWFDDMDHVRDLVARLINCERADIAFVLNASTALGLLIHGIDWKPGDRIVTLTHEFPNNVYGPSLLAQKGIEFVEVPWDRFYDSIDDRTRLVAISSASYITGFAPPLEELSDFLRKRGVMLYIDGTQTIGALKFDVQRIQPDMLAAHGYKWLNSPDGATFMYVAPSLRPKLDPASVGWRSDRNWRNVDKLRHGAPEFADTAEKYEGGMLPFTSLYGLGASLELILEIGPDEIEKRVLDLSNQVREIARTLGGEPVAEDSAIVSIKFEGRDPSPLARSLKEKRVLVSARHGLLRVSTHFYNNEQDIANFRAALTELL